MARWSQHYARDPLSTCKRPLRPSAGSPDIEHCFTLAVSARLMPVTRRPTLARAPKPVRSPENRQPQGSEIRVSLQSASGRSTFGQRPARWWQVAFRRKAARMGRGRSWVLRAFSCGTALLHCPRGNTRFSQQWSAPGALPCDIHGAASRRPIVAARVVTVAAAIQSA